MNPDPKLSSVVDPMNPDPKPLPFVKLTYLIAEAIRELGSIPSGHLYARLQNKMTLDTYYHVIQLLKKANLIKEESFVITWIGPQKKESQ